VYAVGLPDGLIRWGYDMSGAPARWKVVGVGAALLGLLAAGLWLARSPRVPAPARRAGSELPTPSAAPTSAPHYELTLDLHEVQGRSPGGEVRPRQLRQPAEAIRQALTQVYSAAFVDPTLWDGGRFPSLFGFFASNARGDAHRDLQKLTLGRAAPRLSAVRPDRATLDIHFLTDVRRHPIEAFADVHFAGTGIAGGVEIPFWQDGSYVLRRLSGEWRIVAYDTKGRLPTRQELQRKIEEARFSPGVSSNGLLFVLAIGSDARTEGSVTRSRGDSLHIIGVNPKKGVASVVGIPRDSYVPIPGHGTGKINSALVFGGPELMVRTVEQLTGIPIDAYVLTGFDGFERLVSGVGGIQVTIPYPMNDPFSRAFFGPGPTHLEGVEALQFSRELDDVPGGDWGRSLNQGRLIVAPLRQVRTDLLKYPLGRRP